MKKTSNNEKQPEGISPLRRHFYFYSLLILIPMAVGTFRGDFEPTGGPSTEADGHLIGVSQLAQETYR